MGISTAWISKICLIAVAVYVLLAVFYVASYLFANAVRIRSGAGLGIDALQVIQISLNIFQIWLSIRILLLLNLIFTSGNIEEQKIANNLKWVLYSGVLLLIVRLMVGDNSVSQEAIAEAVSKSDSEAQSSQVVMLQNVSYYGKYLIREFLPSLNVTQALIGLGLIEIFKTRK